MGWYENQKARNESHKAQQRAARQARTSTRGQQRAHRAPQPLPAPPVDLAVLQQLAVNTMRPASPEVARSASRTYSRAATLFGIEAWLAGIQLVALLVPVLLVLGVVAWALIF